MHPKRIIIYSLTTQAILATLAHFNSARQSRICNRSVAHIAHTQHGLSLACQTLFRNNYPLACVRSPTGEHDAHDARVQTCGGFSRPPFLRQENSFRFVDVFFCGIPI